MFPRRRSPLLGAAVVYGASRSGARRGMQVEAERQAAMQARAQQQEAAYQAQRQREDQQRAESERQRAESERQRQDMLNKERELARKEAELQVRERAANRPDDRYLAPPQYVGPDALFCTKCGNQCRVGDKFCGGCGLQLPPPGQA
ncbi:hypothetical protein PV10_02512 [Exophiala mesophila]|uniref:Zinc-ribbon domain-containing protein n=1 Tax=Exophiala mesophila TaxID=212818 RepID=A0A0D1WZ49_EXOME|nr:uncharacterized protein PV10_02512 [Exophiala mesophila]KIV94780.1 hypothetical protein PV10_02512 [Exophiala mesophila]